MDYSVESSRRSSIDSMRPTDHQLIKEATQQPFFLYPASRAAHPETKIKRQPWRDFCTPGTDFETKDGKMVVTCVPFHDFGTNLGGY
jgi:hypothetical protein